MFNPKTIKTIKIILVFIVWFFIAYNIGKYVGNYDTKNKTNSIILNSTFEVVNGQRLEMFNKTKELIIKNNTSKGVILYLLSFGGFYFFELGYHTTYKYPLVNESVFKCRK